LTTPINNNRPSASIARFRRLVPNFTINGNPYQTRQTVSSVQTLDTLTFDSLATINLGNSFGTREEPGDFEIRYTINGDVPTKNSSVYSRPIVLDRTISNGEIVTIQAKVFDKQSILSGKLLKIQLIIK